MESQPGVPGPEPERGPESETDDGPFFAWLPPEDRLWRHPSEAASRPQPVYAIADPAHPLPGWTRMVSVALAAGLTGALGASGIGFAAGWWGHGTTVVKSVFPTTPIVSLADAGTTGQLNWNAVDDSVAASVVSITVSGPSGPLQGSGVLLATGADGTGYVVTDRSILTPAQSAAYMGPIQVSFLSGATSRAKLLGEDPLCGLAVIEVPNVGRDTPAATGSVANLQDADPVLAVGARTASLATGAVSAEDRTISLADGTDLDNLLAISMNPMTASATGGPVVDQYGQVVGITVALNPVDIADQQLTFAVPIDDVDRSMSQIIAGKAVTHAWIGISDAEDIPSETARQLGVTGGVEAGDVVIGGPAQKAGIGSTDILTSFGGKAINSVGALIASLARSDPGTPIPVEFVHAGRTEHTVLNLAAEPSDEP